MSRCRREEKCEAAQCHVLWALQVVVVLKHMPIAPLPVLIRFWNQEGQGRGCIHDTGRCLGIVEV